MHFQPEKGAAVPRFGDWDEKNPASGDNYTHAFNIVRHEKISGSPMVPNMSAEQAYATRQKPNGGDKHKVCYVIYQIFSKDQNVFPLWFSISLTHLILCKNQFPVAEQVVSMLWKVTTMDLKYVLPAKAFLYESRLI